MKQCPQCDGKYADDSLNFCLQDGALLMPVSETQSGNSDATLFYGSLDSHGQSAPAVPDLAPAFGAQATVPHYAKAGRETPQVGGSPPTNRLLVGGVLAIAALLLVGVGIGAVMLLRQGGQDQVSTSGPIVANPVESASPISSREGTSTTKPLSTNTGIESEQNPRSLPLQIKATASSVRYSVQSNTYDPSNAIDGNKATAWIEGADGPGWGEWIRFEFDREINLHRILILPGYFKSPAIWARNNRISGASVSFSDGTSRLFDFPDRMERHTLNVGSIRTRWVRIDLEDFYFGKDPDTPISEVAFEWEP